METSGLAKIEAWTGSRKVSETGNKLKVEVYQKGTRRLFEGELHGIGISLCHLHAGVVPMRERIPALCQDIWRSEGEGTAGALLVPGRAEGFIRGVASDQKLMDIIDGPKATALKRPP